MKKMFRLFAVLLCSIALCSSAAAEIIYQNGELNGTSGGVQISPPQSVSNSFIVASQSLITSATLGLVTNIGAMPVSLTYSIGTMPFGSELAMGTVALTNSYQFTFGDTDVFLSTFTLNVILDPGTYFLTLGNGVATFGELGFDINFGPSQAFARNPPDQEETDSSFFLLEGTVINDPGPSPVPEPVSLLLIGTGFACLAGSRRRSLLTAQ